MPVPRIPIDRHSPIPLYFQIARRLTEAVENGELVPGELLPNEIDLAASLNVSRPTMRRAIEELVENGMLTRKRGVGTRVNDTLVRRRVALTSLHDDLTAAGRQPRTQVLRFVLDCVDRHAARELGLPASERLLYCERLRSADGLPLAILRNWLPARFDDITADDLAEQGLYRLLGERNGRPTIARQRITARPATSAQSRLLEIGHNAPLISMQRTAFDAEGRAVEYADNLYRADHYAIEVTVYNR
ncbi:GntR family transcriptional regulator [Micromonospora endophytica]|uniref:GntR family transcriptional regulator n=1 Tax=Micromonospora endophytica TaxID=515350 RepID=A0A2W2CT24_9ACTN|nr:GntR family transcriptional regulator [Micromonospora endophytica]PZG01051.1 GntR family transcriptional regulator [Micromonospora endophytica]RIW47907.1 GntR family transcriptional regulator [Micromonospora endophytica]BCJ62277.1 GntR family transcriptional regulator [Micromonospora endophytica]